MRNNTQNMGQTVTLIGSSGLVGAHLLDLLMQDEATTTIILPVRRDPGISHPKVRVVIMDFADEALYADVVSGSECVFCAVGTTNKKVGGDKDAYRKVDFDIPVKAAKAAAAAGVYSFVLVSAIGANPDNNANFYLKLKGVTEEVVSKEHIPQVVLVRPSFLLGDRKESRPAEAVGKVLAGIISPLLFGGGRKFKAIQASDVAKAMLIATRKLPKGIHVLEFDQMRALVK
jgi:uncharacterized protein YbjT (DUF2867 family)